MSNIKERGTSFTEKQPERRLLDGKTAIITGGAYGIGRAIAEKFLREGAKVAIFDINEKRLQETTKKLVSGGIICGYNVDVRNQKAIKDALKDVEEKIGPVDILVNNAGINPEANLEKMPEEIWQDTIDINLTGSKNMTQIVGGRMKERGIKGSIIFITSIHTLQAFPKNSHYDASKLGMLGLMGATALEWAGDGIRLNAVAPGAIYPTGITENASPEDIDKLSKQIPIGRVGKPEDVANAVVFLASNDMSSYITGHELRVDGGVAIKSPII